MLVHVVKSGYVWLCHVRSGYNIRFYQVNSG